MLILVLIPRIVSLVPSATETVFRLGMGDALVGRSHVCDWPEAARSRPALTRPRLESTSSRGIHDELRSHLAEGLAIYEIDLEALRDLRPTHLLVQDQCSVCAVSPSDLEAALAEWLGEKPTLVRLAPHRLDDVWEDLQRIGDALGCGDRANRLRLEINQRLAELSAQVATNKNIRTEPPRVACIEWLDPLMVAGHWVPELVRLAGGEPVLAASGGPSTTLSTRALIEADPDLIFVECCGFDLEASQSHWQEQSDLRSELRDWLEAKRSAEDNQHSTPATRQGEERESPSRIVLSDGDAFFNRPGPRLVDSAEILAEAIWGKPLAGREAEFGRDWIPAPGLA
ncbi:MAG: cobalamin-binding protein [Myxococcota bacterium]